MPAKLDMYAYRNEHVGKRVIYRTLPGLAVQHSEGQPIAEGTEGKIVDCFDFDYPYMIELLDGRLTRTTIGRNWKLDERSEPNA